MSGRNTETWGIVFGLLVLIGFTLAGVGLFLGLAAHPYIAAVWALLSTVGAVWLGVLQLEHRHDDRLRALDAEQRQAVAAPPVERPSVAEVIVKHRLGRRIGDAERDVIVDALHTHFAAGRLDAAELDERIGQALTARTIDDLILAVRDLPSEVTGR